jgi:hypothetical protein
MNFAEGSLGGEAFDREDQLTGGAQNSHTRPEAADHRPVNGTRLGRSRNC